MYKIGVKKALCEMATNIITREYNWTHWIHKTLSFTVIPNLCNSKTIRLFRDPRMHTFLNTPLGENNINTFILYAKNCMWLS